MTTENSTPEAESETPSAQPTVDLSPEEQLMQARLELKETHDKYLRALAELENAKKRHLRERSEMKKYEGEKFIVDLLDVLDDFERSLQFSESDPEQFKKGVELIVKRFNENLVKWDVTTESAMGQYFDPLKHQALANQPLSEGVEPGTVTQEYKKAYWYKNKLIRPAQVIVAAEEVASE